MEFENKAAPSKATKSEMPVCPQCGKGELIKGKTAYGCSSWKEGCKFTLSFEKIRERAQGKPLTKELVIEIISSTNEK